MRIVTDYLMRLCVEPYLCTKNILTIAMMIATKNINIDMRLIPCIYLIHDESGSPASPLRK
jgi:hypothetical protein